MTYFASLIDSNLYLFPPHNYSHFMTMICLYGATIESIDSNVLAISHNAQAAPVLLRTREKVDWKGNLVIASAATSSHRYRLTVMGCVEVRVYTAQQLRLVKSAASSVTPHAFVRLSLGDFTFDTSVLPCEDIVNWGQNFIIPILNKFFILKVQVCTFISEG